MHTQKKPSKYTAHASKCKKITQKNKDKNKDKNKNKNRQYFLFFSRKRIHLQMFICSDILIN